MPIDPSISRLLDDIPEKPPRSKLELHADVIATLRRKRRTYREIAEFFREHLAITVAPSTIHDFVRVRRRRVRRPNELVPCRVVQFGNNAHAELCCSENTHNVHADFHRGESIRLNVHGCLFGISSERLATMEIGVNVMSV